MFIGPQGAACRELPRRLACARGGGGGGLLNGAGERANGRQGHGAQGNWADAATVLVIKPWLL